MREFFDGDIGVGTSGLGYPVFACPDALLTYMDRYRISKALVYDRGAVESGAFARFDPVCAFCAESERLYPTISLTPPATGEQPPPDELLDIILSRGIKAVRVWPKYHQFDFDPFTFGALLEGLAAHRVPLFYHSQGGYDHPWEHRLHWDQLRETALAFPQLPIIVIWIGMLENRRTLPVLAGCANVLTDLTCVSFQYIEYVVEQFGPRRLLLPRTIRIMIRESTPVGSITAASPPRSAMLLLSAICNDCSRRCDEHDL